MKRRDRHPLRVASAIAKRLVADLAAACDRLEVAGSIRREKAFVHDIDLVAIPRFEEQLDEGLFSLNLRPVSVLEGKLNEMACAGSIRIISRGPKSYRLLTQDPQIPVDIYVASSETWGTLLLIRTGSREHNIHLCSLARRRGMELKADGTGLVQNGQIIGGESEESIFRALGLDFAPPQRRELPPLSHRAPPSASLNQNQNQE